MIFLLDPNNFLMITKKSTSHDALRIALVDFFCKDIKICFFAGDRHWMYTGILGCGQFLDLMSKDVRRKK